MHTTSTTPDHPPPRRRRWPRRLLAAAAVVVAAGAALAVTDAVMRRRAAESEPAFRCVDEEGLFSYRATAPAATPDPDDPMLVTFTVRVEVGNTGDETVALHGVDVQLANGWWLRGQAGESLSPVDLAAGTAHDVTAELVLPVLTELSADEWPTEIASITPQWQPTGTAVRC